MALRHFLERSETSAETDKKKTHWLLVIDHHEARIYRSEMRGAMPQQILPHPPEDYFRHMRKRKQRFENGIGKSYEHIRDTSTSSGSVGSQ